MTTRGGHLEEGILQTAREVERMALEEAAQQTADQAPSTGPVCSARLRRIAHGHVCRGLFKEKEDQVQSTATAIHRAKDHHD